MFLLALVILGAFLVGLATVALRLHAQPRRGYQSHHPLAEELGLAVQPPRQLVGKREGLAVVVHPPEHVGGAWTAIAEHEVGPPPPDPESGGWPEVDAVRAQQGRGLGIEVTSTYVSVTSRGVPGLTDAESLERGLRVAVATVGALRAARRRYAADIVRQLGLPTSGIAGSSIEGELRGVRLTVRLPRRVDQTWETVIVGTLKSPLPDDSRLRADDGRGYGVEIGDRFLDHPLVIVTSDPDELRTRLARDEVRGPLLDLLCRFRPSVLEQARVVHVVRGAGSLEVVAAVERVVELVEAIG